MIIIAGYAISKNFIERDAIVSALAEVVQKVRQVDGCVDASIGADSVDQVRINIFECWKDQQSLDAWRKIAKAPEFLPRGTHIKVYRAEAAQQSCST